jgi:hypothetical protein
VAGSRRRRPPVPRVRAILELLERHAVDYVVIGGIGARLWGSPLLTEDLDICPSTDVANLRRLAAALNDVNAHFRPEGLEEGAFTPPWDEGAFGAHLGGSLAITCELGWIDLWFRPDGRGGYADLIERAATVEVGKLRVRLAALDDIIRSKEASGRQKDLERLPHLRNLRREIEKRDRHQD